VPRSADAARYECGTLNTIGIFGLEASLRYLLGIGIPRIGEVVLGLSSQLIAGARAQGYEVLGENHPNTRSGIVTIRREGPRDDNASRLLVSRLKDAGIIAIPRQGYVRLSPHFYISPEEIGKVIDALG